MGKKKRSKATPPTSAHADFPCPFCDAEVTGETPASCPHCARSLTFCGGYRATRLLGHGGMSHVYAGVRASDGNAVAIKILDPPKDDDWTAWELFERSSRVLQGLHHPLLPKVYGFERTDTGRLVLVREAFDGGTLEERLHERDDRMDESDVRKLLTSLLELLVYLQDRVPPVIHRDIKPSNIMFRDEGLTPVLVDFDTVVSRRSGMTIVGTPGYAAPEQFSGEASLASDVYGLGATMLFVVTHTDADDLPREHGRFQVKEVDRLGADLAHVLRRMVEPDALARYETAKAVLADWKAAKRAAEPAKAAKPQASSSPSPSTTRGGFWRRWGVLLGVAAVAAGGKLVSRLAHESPSSSASSSTTSTTDDANDALRTSCNEGHGDSCFTLALHYDNGEDGVSTDLSAAAKLYERGCNLGHDGSCNNLGVDYMKGYGVTADPAKAATLYEGACTKKNGLACRNLASLYAEGKGVTKDPKRALELRDKGCDFGDGDSCELAGETYDDGTDVKRDPKKAESFYALGCDHGYAWSCRNSGLMYRDGDGVEKDERRAAALFKRACDDKEADGCYQLGRLVAAGRGVEKDEARAAELYQLGCDGNRSFACAALSEAYAKGVGVAADAKKAAELRKKACVNKEACPDAGAKDASE